MSRHAHPVVQAAAASKYLPLLNDTLEPIAEGVKQIVVDWVSIKSSLNATGRTVLKERIVQLLVHLLTAPTPEGKALRMALIAKLAVAESGREDLALAEEMLTTAQAALRLDVSRPYVTMLCNAGKLGEIVLTEGGHRRIRSSAVDAYAAQRAGVPAGAERPRGAGVAAGLYDRPDGAYGRNVRSNDDEASGKTSSNRKTARRPASAKTVRGKVERPK